MAKQLNVNLAFNADTGKAKTQIQELQNLLSQITYSGATSGIGDKISVDLQKASAAAKELQFHLNNAFNTTTGKFDLSLLDRSLKTSSANITQLSTQLLGAGATGQQAFLKLAQSISLADQPMLRVSNRMREFGTVMKNTIKWQLSSSMIHGFMGAINSAYGYAQDLNKSLTDIRIVTGNSADEMARFAEQANKTAKALSTTTNDYAKASLIYFQQGLDDAEVQERTDVTIKMANATGTSAQVVSDQMTAVWNNFDDGSKSLEYYADVMAALGAATASSTDEISQGLQKFAAVSETVGLSYEYATAALTAIMSNTRESADVVGTALKTLFARIQGLQLGETLEDGTDLNKYSQALEKVGISIYESNGELKAMDNILNEMAAKWDTLGNAEQTALAQTVAGVRQYTQLVALMENWDNGDADSFQANLKTISGAEGTLDKQADIYAQSWEAAEKRVRASAEGIYQSLLDDKFFISLNNGFANVLTGIDSFIDGLGGVKPLITGITSIFISNFAHKIPQVLDNLKYNLQILTKSTKDVYDKMASDIYKVSNTQFQAYKDTNGKKGINEDSSLGVALKQANDLTAARTRLALVTDKMSESERQMANTSLSIIQQTQDEVLALTKKKEVLEKNIELQMKAAQSSAGYFNSYDLGETQAHKLENKVDTDVLGLQDFDGMSNLGGSIAANLSQNLFQVIDEANNKARSVGTTWEQVANTTNEKITSIKTALGTEFEAAVENIKTKLSSVNQEDFSNVKKQLLNFLQVLPSGVRDIDAVQKALHALRNSKGPAELEKNFKALDGVLKEIKPNLIHSEKILSSIHGDKIHTLVGNMQDYNSTINEANSKTNILKTMLNEFQPTHVVRMSEAFGALGGMMGNVVTIGRSIKSAFDALSNPDLSGWEKFSTVLMSISMIIPSITSLMRGYATVTSFVNTTTNAYIATKAKELAIETANIAMDGVAAIAKKKNLQVLRQQNASIWAEIVAKKAGIDITAASTIVETALGGAKKISTAEAIKKITALLAENGVEVAGNAIKTKSIVLQTILNALTGQYAGLLMLLGGGLIIGVVKIFDALHTSQKEANESIAEANEKYTEEKQKLDELNTSLEDVKKQIEELQSKGTLSLVEQEELNKLLEQEASLERQVALQEQLTQVAKQNSASTFEDNAKKASSWMDTAPTSEQWTTVYDPAQEKHVDKYYDSIEDFKADIDRMYLDTNGQVIEGQEAFYQEYLDQYNTWVNEYNQAQAKWIEANKDSLLELTEGYQNWFDLYGNNPQYAGQMEQYAKLISDVNKAIYGDQYNDKVLGSMDKTFEASTDQKDKDVVNNIVKDLKDGIVDADPASIAEGFSDTFKQSLLRQGILPDDYAQHLIDEYTRAASALKGEVSLEDLMNSKDFNVEDLEILAHLQLTGEETLEEILAKIDDYKSNTIEVKFSVEGWSSDFDNDIKTLQKLSKGDFVTKEVFDSLNPTAQAAFRNAGDRGYQLMRDNETVATDTGRYYLDTLAKQTHLGKTVDRQVASGNMESVYSKINDLTRKEAHNGDLSSMEQAYLQGLQDVMQDHITNLESLTGKEFENASEAMEYIKSDEYKSFMSENRAERRDANEEAAFRVSNLSDIDDLQNEGLLNKSVNEDRQVLRPKFDDDGQYIGKEQQTIEGTGLNENSYTDALQTVALNHENASEELNDFRQALENGTAEQKEAAESSLLLATRAGELAEETKYSAEEIESMAKQLKTQEKFAGKSGKALAEAAKDQLRFNDAVESASSHMEDWKKSVKDFNKTGKLIPYEEMEQMKEAYGNVLDIDGSELSEDFLTSEKNLELMEKAIYGNEDAYDDLQNAAQEALGEKYSIDFDTSSLTDAALSFNDIEARMAELENDPVALDAYLNSDPVLAAMSDLVTQAGLTAEQATSLLSTMGIDATVINKPGEEVEEVIGSSVTAEASTVPAPFMGMTIGPDGSQTVTEMEASIPVWTTKTEPVTATKQGVGTALEVTSAYGSSGGNVKSAGSGAKKPGGGGGGGQKSEKKKMDKVAKSAVVKRYKRIDDKIDDKQNAAEKASRAMDKLYGSSRIKQMQKYNQLLQEEIGLLQTKKAEAEDYLEDDREDLQSALNDALKQAGLSESIDFTIDPEGLITNYDEIMTQLWAELDKQIENANKNGGADEETQKKIDELQVKIDAVNAAVEQYDETRELIEDIENDMAEKALELYDSQLETLSYEIELNLEISDDSLALIEFQLSQIEDNAFKAAEAINLMGSQAATIEEKMAKTKEALASLTAMTLDGEYTQEQMDLIKEYRDELMKLAQEYAEIRKAVEEQVMAAFEGWREEMDRGISTIEHAGSVLESYKNITDLLGNSISEQTQNDLYSKFGEGIMSNAIDNIEATKAAYEGIKEAQARAQAEYDAAVARGDEASAEMWKNTLNTLNEEMNIAQENMLSAWENALNAVVEQFEQSVERAVEAFRGPLDDLSDKFSRQKETSDMFLDDYAKIYELSKLSRDINKTIDDTESLGGKKKLKGLLEDINKLQEDGVEMSQYDLEYLQKTYDLRLAELELENAQNAKNTVRLSKDNEGNWSYVYTTNTDAVDQAQQKYEDALYAMQDLSSNYIDEMSEKLISTSQEMADALAALRVEDFASYQEYQDAVDAVTQEYQTKLELQEAELNKAIGNNAVLYETDWKNYADKTDYKISKTSEFVTAFRDSLLGSLMDSTTQTSNFMEILAGSAKVLVDSLGAGGKEYFENIGAIMEAAGTSTDAFGEDATTAINATSEASKTAAESVTNMATSMVEDFDNIADAVVVWQEIYSEAITKALKDTESLVAMINAMNAGLVGGDGIPEGVSVTTGTNKSANDSSSNTTGTSNSTSDSSNTTAGETTAITAAEYNPNTSITDNIVKQLVDMDLNEMNPETLKFAMTEVMSSIKLEDYNNLEEYFAAIDEVQSQYAEALENITTGQPEQEEYQGQWSKLVETLQGAPEMMSETIPAAMLPTLTEVIEKIGTNASLMSLGVGQWAAQVIKDEFMQTLEQEVSIMAEFPNVSDHNEIEEAIRNLINTASQYANRK